MTLQKLFNNNDDLFRKIDSRLRSEDLQDADGAERNINDMKVLLTSAKRNVRL